MDVLDDGSLILHQSDVAEYQLCPERARAKWAGEVDDHETDAAAIGTAAHAAIEQFLRGGTEAESLAAARESFASASRKPGFRWVKVAKAATAHRHIETAFRAWLRLVYPMVGAPVAIEWQFTTDLAPGVAVSGVVDLIDEAGIIWDWKTASDLRKYQDGRGGEGWQLRRWGIQPTVYSFAAREAGLVAVEPVSFLFAGLSKTDANVVSILSVERDRGHWAWLRRIALNIKAQVDGGGLRDGPWPVDDTHALCSETWCPNWDNCKGATWR